MCISFYFYRCIYKINYLFNLFQIFECKHEKNADIGSYYRTHNGEFEKKNPHNKNAQASKVLLISNSVNVKQ